MRRLPRIGRFKARRGGITLLLVLSFASALAVTTIPAAADPNEQLQENEERSAELDRKIDALLERKGEVLDAIEVLDQERSHAEEELAVVQAELDKINSRIAETEAQLSRTQQRLAVLNSELDDVMSRLVRRTDLLTDRAVAIYKAGPAAYFETIMGANDIAQLLDRYSYYESVLESDAEAVEAIEVLRAETEQKRADVEEKKAEIARHRARLEKDRNEVASVRARKAEVLAGVEKVLDAKSTLVAQIESKKSSYERAQARIDADSAEIRDLLAGNNSTGVAPSGGGQFVWPAAGSVSSPFGWRTHPIFGDRRFHSGIDIGAGYGASVYAADSGTVTYVGTMSGYGNVVVVDHGGGLATTYNHLSGFSVGSGQSVNRGQVVGQVGCTGYCTGPHLHFEVRVNGNPVDPMPYLQ